jgi:hypothetical protein
MATDMVRIHVDLNERQIASLRFHPDVFRRHAAEAAAAGVRLNDYLARKVAASGIGEIRTRTPSSRSDLF